VGGDIHPAKANQETDLVFLFLCSCQGVRRLRMSLGNTGMLATIATSLLPCPGILWYQCGSLSLFAYLWAKKTICLSQSILFYKYAGEADNLISTVYNSVADPDPYVFGPPGSGSEI